MERLQLAGTVVILALGAALAGAPARSAPEKPSWKGSIPVNMARVARQAKISQADARKAALASVGGKVISTELATESDSLLYEVKIEADGKEHEVLVDAGNGKIVPDGQAGSIVLGLARLAKFKKADAEKVALNAVVGAAEEKSVGDSELEVTENYLVYEIDVQVKGKPGKWEVIVDAGNGKVLATEHETDGGE
jgi:uncharacterized membrane protein YkoI